MPRLLNAASSVQKTLPNYSFKISSLNIDFSSAYCITLDSSGNFFLIAGDNIHKYDSSWVHQWSRSLVNGSGIYVNSMTTDSSGNVYFVGKFANRGVVTKISSTGTLLWSKSLSQYALATDDIFDIIVDSSGNVYCCGNDIGTDSTKQAVLYKLNSSGAVQWSRHLQPQPGTSGRSVYKSLTFDAAGNIITTGWNDIGTPTAIGQQVVVKYDTAGNRLWTSTQSHPSRYATGLHVVSDSSNNIYTGFIEEGISNCYNLAKFDSNGTRLWCIEINPPLEQYTGSQERNRRLAIDSSGNIYYSVVWYISSNDKKSALLAFNSSGAFLRSYVAPTYTEEVATYPVRSYSFGDTTVNFNFAKHNIGTDTDLVGICSDGSTILKIPTSFAKTSPWYYDNTPEYIYNATFPTADVTSRWTSTLNPAEYIYNDGVPVATDTIYTLGAYTTTVPTSPKMWKF